MDKYKLLNLELNMDNYWKISKSILSSLFVTVNFYVIILL